jgi:hypothetical protein
MDELGGRCATSRIESAAPLGLARDVRRSLCLPGQCSRAVQALTGMKRAVAAPSMSDAPVSEDLAQRHQAQVQLLLMLAAVLLALLVLTLVCWCARTTQ